MAGRFKSGLAIVGLAAAFVAAAGVALRRHLE